MAWWIACVSGELKNHAERASLVCACSFLPVLYGSGLTSSKLPARAWAALPTHCCGWAACTFALIFTPAEAVPSDM